MSYLMIVHFIAVLTVDTFCFRPGDFKLIYSTLVGEVFRGQRYLVFTLPISETELLLMDIAGLQKQQRNLKK